MSELIIDTKAGLEANAPKQLQPLPVYDDNHPMLSYPIPEYKETLPNAKMNNLIAQLKMTMKLYGGIGLSANQCGVHERVFVIGYDDFFIACINPKIVTSSEDTIKDVEGCLSFPGLALKLDRAESVNVEYTNENGEVVRQTLSGVTARCFQHELDHMNGIKFTQHVGPVALRLAKQKQEKMIKKHIRNSKKK